jgi:outer membrane protein assembly factor BamB
VDNWVKAVLVAVIVVIAGLSAYVVLVSLHPSTSAKPVSSTASCPPAGSSVGGNLTDGDWTAYHGNNSRTGDEPTGAITGVQKEWAGPTGLDGQVYAEPLVCGDTVFVATEGDSVYAVNATDGAIRWHESLGTPVPGSALPCGDINPSGITGTPVIDVATSTIYVVAYLDTNPIQHMLFGLNIANGSVEYRVNVDPTGATVDVEQQRGALALANGIVYIPYGGMYGDCGPYHGWVVGVPTNESGKLLSYMVPTGRAGGIWSPAGITVAPDGDLFVATGNSDATTTFDFGDAVIELSPTLQELQYFAPTNWAYLNSHDVDLGTVAPVVLPNGDVFQVGKEGVGYLLAGTNLGGIGGQVYNTTICSSAYAGTARVGQNVLVACTDGVFNVLVGATNLTVIWQTSNFDAGAPIVAGDIVWAVNTDGADLLGFNLTTGAQVYSFSLGSVDHFVTPAVAPGNLYVGAGDQLDAFALT